MLASGSTPRPKAHTQREKSERCDPTEKVWKTATGSQNATAGGSPSEQPDQSGLPTPPFAHHPLRRFGGSFAAIRSAVERTAGGRVGVVCLSRTQRLHAHAHAAGGAAVGRGEEAAPATALAWAAPAAAASAEAPAQKKQRRRLPTDRPRAAPRSFNSRRTFLVEARGGAGHQGAPARRCFCVLERVSPAKGHGGRVGGEGGHASAWCPVMGLHLPFPRRPPRGAKRRSGVAAVALSEGFFGRLCRRAAAAAQPVVVSGFGRERAGEGWVPCRDGTQSTRDGRTWKRANAWHARARSPPLLFSVISRRRARLQQCARRRRLRYL
eukprot:355668-Chlamydomonas_euryale.AAC.4